MQKLYYRSQLIEQQQIKHERSLAEQLREAIKNQEQDKSISKKRKPATYLRPEPETHYLKKALSVSTELFGGLLANMPEEDDVPVRKRKKKQEHEQNRGISR